ncbi:hypothetical protein DFR39_104147 [Roseateles asaccharophilus]|uniref:Uncharacterized protein n=1 Tax=Roseateles asaccharophilus TaxID=582607 RepID=A0A4R6N3U3_9BURK|nr:hypothetical protein DFR39_104147 [Roseateles asaccharophilus]
MSAKTYCNHWREHGTAFWKVFIHTGLRRVFPGYGVSGCEDCASARAVVDDFGSLVVVEGWK